MRTLWTLASLAWSLMAFGWLLVGSFDRFLMCNALAVGLLIVSKMPDRAK